MEQRFETLERMVAEQGVQLRKRLDGLERLAAEQAAAVGEAAARHGVLQGEHEALCNCISAAGLVPSAVLQARGAQPCSAEQDRRGHSRSLMRTSRGAPTGAPTTK